MMSNVPAWFLLSSNIREVFQVNQISSGRATRPFFDGRGLDTLVIYEMWLRRCTSTAYVVSWVHQSRAGTE
jgi:hypothetical protein